MKYEKAETIGLTALGWLIGNEDLLGVFMGATGVGVDELRAGVQDAELLSGVLGFIVMDDRWIVEFCDAHDLPYADPVLAQQLLSGGGNVEWT